MARIRTIKPEFWVSEQLVECSVETRLLFIGLWNFCDDRGIHPASEKRAKMEIFPADDYTSTDIRRMIDELIRARLLAEYSTEMDTYWIVTGWHHQRIDRPSYKYLPPPDNIINQFDEDSSSATPRKGREGKGKEGKGREGIKPNRRMISEPSEPGVVFIPLVDKSEFPVTQTQIDEFSRCYPAVDVEQELRNCRSWNIANVKNRKTKSGILRHLNTWLAKAQNSARPSSSNREKDLIASFASGGSSDG